MIHSGNNVNGRVMVATDQRSIVQSHVLWVNDESPAILRVAERDGHYKQRASGITDRVASFFPALAPGLNQQMRLPVSWTLSTSATPVFHTVKTTPRFDSTSCSARLL